MSELQDAAQIIRVTFEGTEILMKLGKSKYRLCKRRMRCLYQYAAAGKTCRKDLSEKTSEIRRGLAGVQV